MHCFANAQLIFRVPYTILRTHLRIVVEHKLVSNEKQDPWLILRKERRCIVLTTATIATTFHLIGQDMIAPAAQATSAGSLALLRALPCT